MGAISFSPCLGAGSCRPLCCWDYSSFCGRLSFEPEHVPWLTLTFSLTSLRSRTGEPGFGGLNLQWHFKNTARLWAVLLLISATSKGDILTFAVESKNFATDGMSGAARGKDKQKSHSLLPLLSFEAGVINLMNVVDAIPVYHSDLIIYAFSSHATLLKLIMKSYPTRCWTAITLPKVLK